MYNVYEPAQYSPTRMYSHHNSMKYLALFCQVNIIIIPKKKMFSCILMFTSIIAPRWTSLAN